MFTRKTCFFKRAFTTNMFFGDPMQHGKWYLEHLFSYFMCFQDLDVNSREICRLCDRDRAQIHLTRLGKCSFDDGLFNGDELRSQRDSVMFLLCSGLQLIWAKQLLCITCTSRKKNHQSIPRDINFQSSIQTHHWLTHWRVRTGAVTSLILLPITGKSKWRVAVNIICWRQPYWHSFISCHFGA